MTEPTQGPPPLQGFRPPQPFNPEQPQFAGGGCGKPLLVGCGLLLLLLAVACAVVLVKAPDLVRWGLGITEETILSSLPEDVTDEERTRLETAFSHVADALATGRLDVAAQQKLQQELFGALQKIQRQELERQDVLDLTTALEELAGVEGPTLGTETVWIKGSHFAPRPSEAERNEDGPLS